MPFDGLEFATVRLLQGARQLIARGWCQDARARDQFGFRVLPEHERAARWCALGALYRTTADEGLGYDDYQTARRALEAAVPPGSSVPQYNDEPGRQAADVIELFDLAIVRLEASQGLMSYDWCSGPAPARTTPAAPLGVRESAAARALRSLKTTLGHRLLAQVAAALPRKA